MSQSAGKRSSTRLAASASQQPPAAVDDEAKRTAAAAPLGVNSASAEPQTKRSLTIRKPEGVSSQSDIYVDVTSVDETPKAPPRPANELTLAGAKVLILTPTSKLNRTGVAIGKQPQQQQSSSSAQQRLKGGTTKTIVIHPAASARPMTAVAAVGENGRDDGEQTTFDEIRQRLEQNVPETSPGKKITVVSEADLQRVVAAASSGGVTDQSAVLYHSGDVGGSLTYVSDHSAGFGGGGTLSAHTPTTMDPYSLAAGGGPSTPHHLQSGATYAVYTSDNSAYAPAYYQQFQYQPVLHSPGSGCGGPVTPGSAAYILSPQGGGGPANQQQSPHSGVTDDESAASAGHLSHTTRASPATIQWLLANYETAEGVSLPRCTLYTHYLRHCTENKLDPVNAASFGKLIRSVFLGLRTRRLGTRGNSKYHYYGIRIKLDSPLNRMPNEDVMAAMGGPPVVGGGGMAIRPTAVQHSIGTRRQALNKAAAVMQQHQQDAGDYGEPEGASPPEQSPGEHSNGAGYDEPSQQHQPQHEGRSQPGGYHSSQHQPSGGSTFAADSSSSATASTTPAAPTADPHSLLFGVGFVPDLPAPAETPQLLTAIKRLGIDMHGVHGFVNGYKQNCQDMLDSIKRLAFNDVDECWRNFWQPESDENDSDSPSGLSQTQLFSLCTVAEIQRYVGEFDFAFYQVLVDVMIPNVLKTIPPSLIQHIRNFAKSLEHGLSLHMQGAPDEMREVKLTAVKSLAQTLRRYTSLNHLAQAARTALQNASHLAQMLQDLNRVDFHNVHEQAQWVCGPRCDAMLVDQLERAFKANLSRHYSLEQWAGWLEAVIDQVLAPYYDRPVQQMATVAKQFLLKWSFYGSMVIRDLTLRSAASFGSFHLIRLLYDEYMFYLVEKRLAKATALTSIAIMAQQPSLLGDLNDPIGNFSLGGNSGGRGLLDAIEAGVLGSAMSPTATALAFYNVASGSENLQHGATDGTTTPDTPLATAKSTGKRYLNGNSDDGGGGRMDAGGVAPPPLTAAPYLQHLQQQRNAMEDDELADEHSPAAVQPTANKRQKLI